MSFGEGGGRVSDLHKSAFWIYGVTAMVMREPLATVIRHSSGTGLASTEVQLEVLRVVAVLVLMARLFLASGLYFDEVHLRPDSAARFPRRSYPVDFLSGLVQFLLIVAASTTIGAPAVFAAFIGAVLLYDDIWLITASLMRLSTTPLIARTARSSRLAFLACGVAYGAAAAVRAPAAGFAPLLLLLSLSLYDIGRLVRAYDRPASGAARG